jgi:hypothetical protein
MELLLSEQTGATGEDGMTRVAHAAQVAIARALPSWISNLHGVLREYGWSCGSTSAEARFTRPLDRDSRSRLSNHLTMLLRAFVPETASAAEEADAAGAKLAPTAPRATKRTVTFKSAGMAVRAGLRMGESFLRVHWVAVPMAMRARRVNRLGHPRRRHAVPRDTGHHAHAARGRHVFGPVGGARWPAARGEGDKTATC